MSFVLVYSARKPATADSSRRAKDAVVGRGSDEEHWMYRAASQLRGWAFVFS